MWKNMAWVVCVQVFCVQGKKCKGWFQRVVSVHVLTPQIDAILPEIYYVCRLLVCIPAVVILWSIVLAMVYTSCVLGFFSTWFFYLWLQVTTVFKSEIVYSVAGLLAYTFTVTSG